MIKNDYFAQVKEEKLNEVLSRITSFGKSRYCKADYEGEMRKLQHELLCLIFEEEHVLSARLTIWDVYNQLERECKERGDVATEELAEFKVGCRMFSDLIRAEISGNKGESMVFSRLSGLKIKNKIFRNVELVEEGNRSELDMVVVTEKTSFILEIKNTKTGVFIDEKGDYYRTGEYMNHDCNLLQKMNNRQQLLTNVLEDTLTGLEKPINIVKVIVFTNKWIEVRNKCGDLKVCSLAELPYYIEDYVGENLYSEEDIIAMADAISNSAVSGEYEPEMDMQKFKTDFAKVLVAVEDDENKLLEESVKVDRNVGNWHQMLQISSMPEENRNKLIVGGVAGIVFITGLCLAVAQVIEKRK